MIILTHQGKRILVRRFIFIASLLSAYFVKAPLDFTSSCVVVIVSDSFRELNKFTDLDLDKTDFEKKKKKKINLKFLNFIKFTF